MGAQSGDKLPLGVPGNSPGSLARKVARIFHELSGLSLEVTVLPGVSPVSMLPGLCPNAIVNQQNGLAIALRCGAGTPVNWVSGQKAECLSCEFRGACGCWWATLNPQKTEAITLRARDVAREGVTSALIVLRLIIRRLQAEVEVTRVRQALDEALLRIRTLEQGVRPKDLAVMGSSSGVAGFMREFAEANCHRPVQLQDVAAVLNMNPSYLCWVFSKSTGTTFHAYLERLRLAKARELLRDPARRINEIAASVGFCSAGHFCRVFKARLGRTPRDWRRASPQGAPVTGP